MSTWGPGILEDDCTQECFQDMRESESIEYISNALEDAGDATYLDYETSCAAVLSAAVIDAIVNDTDQEPENEEFTKWVEKNRKMPVRQLKPLAVKALQRVMSEDSELYEYWMENDEGFPEWKTVLERMVQRLSE